MINRSAVLHIPMSQYAFGTDERHVTIRLRAGRGNLKKCVLFFGDRACRKTPVIFTKKEMHIVAQSELFDFFQVELEDAYKRMCYYFLLEAKGEQILYYGDQFSEHPVDDRSEYFQLPFNHRADIVTPPDWAKDAIIYNIFPDSFATGENYISCQPMEREFKRDAIISEQQTGQEQQSYCANSSQQVNVGLEKCTTRGKLGGTIRGIIENVEYLVELGVNAIYINPIFVAGEYHKYDLIDYFHIDPCFGSNEDFKELVKIFHEKGIRVIIDGVFNHCGWKFFAFEDVVKNGEKSKYKDWFYSLEFPVVRPEDPEDYPNYECFGYERLMPKLNTANREVQDYFCRVGRFWVEEFHTDGWRLDVASEVNDGFWRSFYQEVKSVNPDAILIGEVWESANHWLDGTIFDSAMNYDFRKHCKRFFGDKSIDALEFDSRVTDMRMRYRSQTVFAQLNVLDSHDVSRFLSICDEDMERYQLAVLFQMTFPGMPSIFYGDEQGIAGVQESDYRKPMIWDKKDKLFGFFQQLIKLRKEEVVLRRGGYRTIEAQRGSRLYCYERYLDTECIRVILNMEEHEVELGDEFGMNKVMMVSQCNSDFSQRTAKILLEKGLSGRSLDAKGYLVIKFLA